MAMHICKLFLLGLLCIALLLSSAGATTQDDNRKIKCIFGDCADCGRRCILQGFRNGECDFEMECCCQNPF
ncbi:unnamed protein product [Lathyrus oleraceus]